jgi:tetraacyldisaccharide 4'-kinase
MFWNLRQNIESVMKKEENSRTGSFGSFLFAVSLLYGSIVRTREFFYRKKIFKSRKLPCKVISVGNLTVGGTGKTPMTIHLARRLSSQGYKTAVISRGYGRSEKSAAIVSDGHQILLQSDEAGDEPFMIARNLKHIPVIVGQNRVKAGWLAIEKFAPDVIVLDDAFQHLKLVRDIDLVLLDYHRPYGNNHLLPRGTLREPISALARADAFILTRCDAVLGEDQAALKKIIGNRPVFKTVHSPYISELISSKAGLKPLSIVGLKPALQGRKGFVFSGIAGNRDFRSTLKTLGCRIAGFSEFADHHRYSASDIEAISDSAYKAKADILVTTEKDYVRISPETRWTLDLAVVGAEISFGADDEAFGRFIEKVRNDE